MKQLHTKEEFEELIHNAGKRDIIIFVQNSSMDANFVIHNRVLDWAHENNVHIYKIDTVESRELWKYIAEYTGVMQEEPQVLQIRDHKVISHAIYEEITDTFLLSILD